MLDKRFKSFRKKKPEAQKTISYFQIFRYATWIELLATIFGVILGFLSAVGVAFSLMLYGETRNSLVDRTSFQERTSNALPLMALMGGGRVLTNASNEENMRALKEDAVALASGMTGMAVLCLLVAVLSVKLVIWSALRQLQRIRMLFLNAVLRQDMAWYDTDTSFNLASRMSEDFQKLRSGMGEKLTVISNYVGSAVICLSQALPLGWQLALVCMCMVPVTFASSILLSRYQTLSSMKEMNMFSKAGKLAEEILKSIRTVKAFGGEQKSLERYQSLLLPAAACGEKRGVYNGIGTSFNWFLAYSVNYICIFYGTGLVLNDMNKPASERQYSVGNLFGILFSVYIGIQSITFCVPHMSSFTDAKAAATNIFKLIDQKPQIDCLSTGGLKPRNLKGDILLEKVKFSYPSRPNVKILKEFSLHIKPGENVAIVGSSGCGKSTILQLIQRLYDPESGEVKLDGRCVKKFNLGWLRSSIGIVGQEPVLFRGTIRENIMIGDPDATQEQVEAVAKIAFAHGFIVNLSNGYETLIGERGTSLSGGQKQRIAIARALLRDPAILLLDEATSALDPQSEKMVQVALDKASQGRTTVSVSHRLSTIVNADRIVCMDQGTIVEMGTHEELMNKQGIYWKLVTTGKETKEPDIIENVMEDKKPAELAAREDRKRHSSRKTVRNISMRRDSFDFAPGPRYSISSSMAAEEVEVEDVDEYEDEEPIPEVSSWDILKQNLPEWHLILIGCIAAFVLGACFPVMSIVMGYIVLIFSNHDAEVVSREANFYAGLLLLNALVSAGCTCLQSVIFTKTGLKMTTRLRVAYFKSLLNQEMGYYDRQSNTVGTLCNRLSNDVAEVKGATGLRIGLILQGFSSLFIGLVIGFIYSWKISLVGCAMLPMLVGSVWLEGVISKKSVLKERAIMETFSGLATEAVVSIRTVQSLAVENIFLKKLSASMDLATEELAVQNRWRGVVYGTSIYAPFLCFMSTSCYGMFLVADEGLQYNHVLIVTVSIMYGAYILGASLIHAPNFNSARACGARIIATINRVPKVKTADGLKDRRDWVATGDYSFNNVEMSYPTRPHLKVLQGLTLKVESGKTVALVGASGCGKSTVLQLLLRFYDPDSGTIELDNLDITKAVTLPRLRRQLGVVQQEPTLFDATLADNIAYGDNGRAVSMQEIIAAAKAANIHNFIASLPNGYDTNLGPGGAQLSGGQKQRVCIARALIRSPRLLLLDEATSALDASSEKAVSEALDAAAKGRTCITIAHRLSTIKDADLICVIHKGKIVEQGTHAELLSLGGHYWKMSQGQPAM
ncbi:multidrug resistance protein homolog 49 [Plutella xylostella]|uniref:multidrug resistance protein homolog 49 n=1 Tax=Plutella xylostella TaxID=51655 RepID=UPI002032717F|nr:multidrug resistance protein homolog 49 [Plutella xylostella]